MSNVQERFWKKVIKTDTCWNWCAATTKLGYGCFTLDTKTDKKIYAHRMSWSLKFGPIPDNLQVLHTCDNRKCVNPEHLFLGSHTDNMVDKRKKNRGRSIPRALNNAQAMEVRKLFSIGKSKNSIARQFNVSISVIQNVLSGLCYKT